MNAKEERRKKIGKQKCVFEWVVVVVRHKCLGYYPEWLLVEILQPDQFLVAIR